MNAADQPVPDAANEDSRTPRLRRSLGFWALTLYGVGDILGAGIYALMGKVADRAGAYCWLSFVVAMGIASLTGLSYAELVTRFPRSGGEAFFAERAFGRKWLSTLVGWLVFASGVVSLAAVAHGFTGYVQGLQPDWPKWPLLLAFLAALSVLNWRGIRESSAANVAFTVVEASGLLFVLIAGLAFLAGNDGAVAAPVEGNPAGVPWIAVLQGAALAFYAFIGFEDMVNVAEEVREPRRHFPAAIVTAVLVAGGLYVAVALVATSVVAPAALGESEAPLLEVVRVAAPWMPEVTFALVALFAVANTGLLNFVMASRLVYGMSREGLLPKALARVHPTRRTPHVAILVVLALTIALAFSGTLERLAATTSVILLTVFLIVNAALIRLRLRDDADGETFRVPLFVPCLGAICSVALACFAEPATFLAAGGVLAVGVLVTLAVRTRGGWIEGT